jgi:hypothetical protein
MPEVICTKVKLSEIRQHLPADTPEVTPEERREMVRIRQEHVQKRYRQY